ncbi:polyketide cyclase/dehydrase/lipid transport protein [Fluviicoccus keumensis]|uniref:Polyketide cyclase/dehydrase/lipid transport protein n=2 Tax=Fluviicoccus keumensis TaxID=1435465 RepID=A0A4Q7YL16_9GAMM|nr:polyketide cyclase/dehydrase/lipid transport protein [Fluviicoccus keumensis]
MPGLIAACLMTAALADGGWELAREDASRQIRVFTRSQADSDYDEFRSEMLAPQSIDTVVAVLRDIPAWPEWIARIRKVKLLRHDGESNWVYVVYKLPYPFKDRDTVLQSVLQREAKGGVVTIRSQAVRTLPMPEQDSRRVHLYELQSTWRLTPLPGGGTRIELSGRGQPGGYLPSLIFNYNLADEPQQTLRLLRLMLARPKYQPRK